MIDLIASGIVTTGQATNVTLKLYSGTSLTLGSDSILAAPEPSRSTRPPVRGVAMAS